MGDCFSYLLWGENPDQPNSISGLTRRDVQLIQKSWRPMYKNCLTNGTELFRRYFRADPEAKSYFKMLRDVREAQYQDVAEFRAHVIAFMTSLNTIICYLYEPEEVRAMVHKIARSHNSKDIDRRHFGIMKEVMTTMLIERLRLNQKATASWCRAINFVWQCLYEKIDAPSEKRRRTRIANRTHDYR